MAKHTVYIEVVRIERKVRVFSADYDGTPEGLVAATQEAVDNSNNFDWSGDSQVMGPAEHVIKGTSSNERAS